FSAKRPANGGGSRNPSSAAQIRRRCPLNPETRCCSPVVLNWIGVIGAFLVMAALVAALKHYAHTPSVNVARAQERQKILAETRQKATDELGTALWLDKEKGFVRLPNSVATALSVKMWQDPTK